MSMLLSYNATIAAGATEPVTLADVKAYLRVDFDDDDDLITALITAARQKCEKLLGLVLVETDITAYYATSNNTVYGSCPRKNRFEIFYGPVLEESGVPAFTGLPDDAKIIGSGTGIWIETYSDCLDISYSSGWDAVPEWAILAVKKQTAWDYEHRGDEVQQYAAGNTLIAPETAAILGPHRITMNEIVL